MAIEINTSAGNSIEVTQSDGTSVTFNQENSSVSVSSPASTSVQVLEKGVKGDAGADGQGVPTGGSQFQILRKVSGTDYDTEWDYADRVTLEVRFDEAVSKGDPLYITGYNNGQNRITVAKADAADSAKMPSIGLAKDDYSQNDNGQATCIGSLDDVNTQVSPNDFQEGDVLYVKAGGGLTNVKPTGTNLIQNVGKVGRRQQNNGEIVVMAIGRSNDIPNIPTGNIWAGNASSVATATSVAYIDIANSRVGVGTVTPTETLHVVGGCKIEGDFRADAIEINGRSTTPATGEYGAGSKLVTQFATGSVTAGKVYVANAGAWAEGDADAGSTSIGMIAVATNAASATEMLIEGTVKLSSNTGFSGAAAGTVLYLSTTAGELTTTAPSATGDYVRVCGYVVNASTNEVFFSPSRDWTAL